MERAYYFFIFIYPLIIAACYLYFLKIKIDNKFYFTGFCIFISVGILLVLSLINGIFLLHYNSELKITCQESSSLVCDLGAIFYEWGPILLLSLWIILTPLVIHNLSHRLWLREYEK